MKIILDGAERKVFIQVDYISRIRSADGDWNFYTDEDIECGYIAIEGVISVDWNNSKRMPNDYIGYFKVEQQDQKRFLFLFSSDSVDSNGSNHEVVLKLIAEGVYLSDPAKPGVEIRN